MSKQFKYLLVILFSMTLIACGGGGGGGDDGDGGPATISANNEEDLAIAATEGAKSAVSSASAPLRGVAGRAVLNRAVQDHANKLIARVVDVSSSVCTGGSASSDINDDASLIVTTYNNCGFAGGVIDGVVRIVTDAGDSTTTTTIEYEGVTFTSGGTTETLNLSVSCVSDNETFESTCTYDSDIDGIDGRTYSVSGSTVTGDSSSGYTISATVTDPDHGTFSIETTSPILFNCSTGQPSSGEIRFSDADDVVVTVTFNDCTSFTISYDGGSGTYNW